VTLEHHISENVLSNEALRIFFNGEDIAKASFWHCSDLAFLGNICRNDMGSPGLAELEGCKTGATAGLVVGSSGLG